MSDKQVIIAGAGGIIGQRLIEALRERGGAPNVSVLTRRADGTWPDGVTPFVWNPAAARQGDAAELDRLAAVLDGAAGLLNLAGSSIAAGRLDAAHRARVVGSRVDATTTLVAAAARAEAAPRVWLQGSAVGLYGDRGDEVLTDASDAGDPDFALVPMAEKWEAAAAPAAERSRLVVVRFGVVFDREAEAWQKLLLPVKLFAGGPLGSGRQWMPWVSGRDVGRALAWLLDHDVAGVVNVTAPEPARQIDVTRAAAKALGRPVWLPAPAFALRIVLGGVADALLLASQRVVPARLLEAGFAFEDTTIDAAMPDLI
ncbi:MAG: TIGR01777 family oxidoreductase [Trueperaceae bacterium]